MLVFDIRVAIVLDFSLYSTLDFGTIWAVIGLDIPRLEETDGQKATILMTGLDSIG